VHSLGYGEQRAGTVLSAKRRAYSAINMKTIALLAALGLPLAMLSTAQAGRYAALAGAPAIETAAGSQVTFTDVSARAGFFGENSSWSAAWADYDGDGNVDVMTIAHLHSPSQLWHNNGDGTFSDATSQAGLISLDGDAHGAVWADFDGDGYVDLYISKGTDKTLPVNYNDLWRNNGDGTFTNIASSAGVTGIGRRNRGSYAVDYDRDSDLDIFATSFAREAGGGINVLFRNDGDLKFTDVGSEAGLGRDAIENRTSAWADFDGDGLIDVLITKSCGLFKNRGDGTFADVTATAGIISSVHSEGAAWGDYDNDGDSDLYVNQGVSNQGVLYRNNGDGTFADVTTESRVFNLGGALGATWGDYNNDGYLDLYIVNSQGAGKPNKLFQNNGDGTFRDAAALAKVEAKEGGRGTDASFIDYDNDGFLDLFVCNGGGGTLGPYLLYRNNGNSNGWLKVVLTGTRSNRSGLGAKLFLTAGGKTQFREYTGQHYMAQNYVPIHFGLGQATIVDSLTIQWPSGITQKLNDIAINQTLPVIESADP